MLFAWEANDVVLPLNIVINTFFGDFMLLDSLPHNIGQEFSSKAVFRVVLSSVLLSLRVIMIAETNCRRVFNYFVYLHNFPSFQAGLIPA